MTRDVLFHLSFSRLLTLHSEYSISTILHSAIVLKADRQNSPLEDEKLKPWWPRTIIKPRVRLTRPRFTTPTRPPDIILFGIVFIAVLFILGGNVYTLVRTPPAIAGGQGGAPILVAPGIDIQLGLEGIVASVTAMMGTAGLGLVYYASKYVFQPGYATRLMVLGMILAGLSFLIFSYLFGIKMGAI
ncbi:MAG: hypothetical protein ACXABF_05530 [Candidatus Thorarchaeota archaeon]